jgi:hypothetical protein
LELDYFVFWLHAAYFTLFSTLLQVRRRPE